MAEQWHGMPVPLGSIPGGPTLLFCSFAISEVFRRNGMIQRSLIRPGLIGLRTKIGDPTIGLPAVILLRFSMIIHTYEYKRFKVHQQYLDVSDRRTLPLPMRSAM